MSCSSFPKKELPKDVEALVNNHPCYNEEAHHHYARIHVAVAPACNIQCNYCNRKYDCSNESRPGVTSERVSPEEAIKKVLHVGAQIPQLSVVGIAGPGDALANPKATFETFGYLNRYAPDLKLCISTNGLALIDHIDALKAHKVHHVTVTINSVDESGEVGAKIYPWIFHNHKRYRGVEAAKILLKRQLEGIKACVDAGILVKANSVLIPHINDKHLGDVAKVLRDLGVFLHNVMPLISKKEYGTKFGLEGIPSASPKALMKAQEACGTDMKLMKHCRQCRADAVGLINQDRKDEFGKESFNALSIEELANAYDITKRQETHARIETWRRALKVANARLETEKIPSLLVAVTSAGEGLINQHFGAANEFMIYEVDSKGVRFSHHRKVETQYCHGPSECGNNPMDEIAKTLEDIDLIVTAKIGPCPKASLERYRIQISEEYAHEPIEASLLKAAKAFVPFAQEKVG